MDYSGIAGDLDADRELIGEDLDLLVSAIRFIDKNSRFDLTLDVKVDQADLDNWIHDLKQTYYGDANLDGEFNSADLVDTFAAGKYKDGISTNARWESGD